MFEAIKNILEESQIDFTEKRLGMFNSLSYKGKRLSYGQLELEDISYGVNTVMLHFRGEGPINGPFTKIYPINDLDKFEDIISKIIQLNDVKNELKLLLGRPKAFC